MSVKPPSPSQEQNRSWRLLFLWLSLGGLFCLALLLSLQDAFRAATPVFVPVNLHSQLEANYSVNPDSPSLPGVRLDIIWDVIDDLDPGAIDQQARQDAFQNSLLTPVPTVTPALLTCEGIHFVYAGQDTWTDAADPAALHGHEPSLQLGHSGNQAKRVLLHFPIHTVIPPNTLIHSARLEMDVQQIQGRLPPETFHFANLAGPFSETDTNWSNQPEAGLQSPAKALALDTIHVWDVTGLVREWLAGQTQNTGLVIELQPAAELSVTYYSREIIAQTNPTSDPITIPVGPRLIINCGGQLPQAVAFNPYTPTPTSVQETPPVPNAATSTALPPALTPTLLPPTPTLPAPSPTLPLPTLTPPLPTPASPSPEPTDPLPVTATPPPTPTSTPTPSPGDDDDDNDDGNDDDDDGGGGSPDRADLEVAKSAPLEIIAGANLLYTLNVTNRGPDRATNVIVTDTLPPGVSLISATVDQGPGCAGAVTLTCGLGTLNRDDAATITIIVRVGASTVGSLTNSATVSTSETDPVPGNNTATVTTTITPITDLAVSKHSDPTTVIAGQRLTYTLNITNTGPSDATGVIITDTLPGGVTFASASPGCSNAGGIVTCTVGSLNPGASLQRTIVVTVNTNTTASQTNTATVGSDEIDPNSSNNTATVTTTVQTEADLIIAKLDTPDPIAAGQLLTYTLSITNAGPSDATGVIVTDTLPGGVTFGAASPGCTNTAGIVTCAIGGLNAGSNVQRTIVVTVNTSTTTSQTNTAIAGGNEPDPNNSNNTATVTTTVQTEADLIIAKVDTPDPVIAGQLLTYTLSITNAGPSDATSVIMTDTLPGGVTFASASPGCTNVGGTVTCAIGSLNTGGSVQRTIVVTVNTGTTTGQANTATVDSNEIDPNSGNNTAVVTTTVQAEADLVITKLDTPDPVVAGQLLTYTLTLTNNGPSDATGVLMTDTLPSGVTFASASGGCANAGGIVTCAIGNLNTGSSVQRTIVVTVNTNTTAGQTNTAIIDGNETDPNASNNTDTVTTTIQAEADLTLTKLDTPDPVIAGQLLTYTLGITNNGPSDATGVIITDTLPGGATFASASPGCSNAGGIVTCATGSLNAGSSLQRTIVVTVNVNTTTSQTNTATVGGSETDPVPANNTATVTTTVQAETDLAIAKLDTPDPVVAGQLLTYTLGITNNGPSDATGVIVTDTLPGGVTFASASPGCSHAGGTVTCNIGTLGVGGSVQRTVVVTVNTSAITSQTNIAIVGGAGSDLNSGNNTAVVTTTVQTEADLMIDKSDTPDPAAAGGTLTYTLALTNAGPSDAAGVIMTDTLPGGVTFASASTGCTHTGGSLTCTVGSLAAGASILLTVSVNISPTATGSLTNTAEVSATTIDPASLNNIVSITTTIVNAANLSLIKQDSSDPVLPGGTFTYTLVAANLGPSEALNVSLTDTLPASLTLVFSATSQGSCSGALICNLGTLPANGVATVTLRVTVDPAATAIQVNTANITSTVADPDLADNTAVETTAIGSLSIVKTSSSGGPVSPGQVMTYTIVVQNIGSAVQTNVTITDTLPAGVSYVPGTTLVTAPVIETVRDEFNMLLYNGNNGSQPWATDWQEITESNGPGLGRVQVVPDARCAAVNCARIGGLNLLITNFGLSRQVDLSSAVAAILTFNYRRQQLLLPGGNIRLGVSNNGGGSWADLQTYPLNGSDNAQISQGFDISPYIAANTAIRFIGEGGLTNSNFFVDNVQIQYSEDLTTTLGGPPPLLASGFTLLPSEKMTVTFQVVVDDPLSLAITTLTNTAAVTSALQTVPITSSVTDLAQQADLTLTKLDTPDPVIAGQLLTYTLSITNNGPANATGVTITDTLPGDVTFASASGGCANAGGTVTCNIGNLASGGSVQRTIVVTVNTNAATVQTNTATIDGVETDPNSANNTATITTTVQTSADLQISKADLVDPALIGQPLTYTLLVTNAGPATATNVVITDTLPAGVTFGSATTSQGLGCVQAGGLITCTLGTLLPTGLPKIQSAFTSSAEGWTVSGNGASTTPTYNAAGGNPGGYISAVDSAGTDFYFEAPAPFLGNQAAAYLGNLEFDLQRSAGATYPLSADVMLSGGGLTLITQITTPNTSWTHYTLALHESAWINTLTDAPPTSAEMVTVLSNLAALQIRGDFVTGAGDSSGLDNVILTYGPARAVVVVTPTDEGNKLNEAGVTAAEPDPDLANNIALEDTQTVPGLSINSVSVIEGDSGTVSAVFTVTLSLVSSQVITVDYTTAGGTAGAGIDYNSAAGTITFPAGTTVQTFTVLVNGDLLEEATETFFATLSNPINALLGANQGVGTIIDDDDDPTTITICLPATQDTYIREHFPNSNHGAEAQISMKLNPSQRAHALIGFDLSAIPGGSNVFTSTLFLYEKTIENGQTMHLHRLTSSWLEAEATWNEGSASVPWGTPGGDYVAAPELASFIPDVQNQYRQIDLTGVTQDWVNGTFTNEGILLRTTGSNGQVDFSSSEDPDANKQPQLCVTYEDVTPLNLNGGAGKWPYTIYFPLLSHGPY